jgi:hypothetical protein
VSDRIDPRYDIDVDRILTRPLRWFMIKGAIYLIVVALILKWTAPC